MKNSPCPGCSLEGLMLRLKLQYFGHLMWRVDSLEKTLMLGGIGGRKRRGQQRMRWLDGTFLRAHVLSCFSHVQFVVMLWTVAHQASLSMGFSRQGYQSWVAMPSAKGSPQPRDLICISYIYLHWQEGYLPLVPPGKPNSFLPRLPQQSKVVEGFLFHII